MMIKIFTLATALIAFGMASAGTFYVSASGDDNNDGSKSLPFKTIAQAIGAFRDLRTRMPSDPVEIVIGAGSFEVAAPICLTEKDTTAPVTFRGVGRDKTILSGGRRLTMRPQPGGIWGVCVPEVKTGAWKIEQLYVNGRRALRPALPRGGYYTPADILPNANGKAQADRFVAAEGQFSADWIGLTNEVEVVLMHGWNISRLRVKSYDPKTRAVVLNGGRGGWMRDIKKDMRFRLENVGAAFGEVVGEWYCNTKTGWIYYRPLPGEKIETAEIIAPYVTNLITLQGTEKSPVQNVTLRNLTLAHQAETLASKGTTYSQTSPNAGGAFVARYGRNLRLENVAVRMTGGWGVKFCEGCSGCRLTNSLLYDIGAGGALVGLDRREKVERGSALWSHACEISNCEVFGYGRVQPGGVGVNLMVAGDCRVTGNVIHDGYYSGINSGYEWSFGGTGATGNLIADNHIYDIGKGVFSDMGGIYTLGGHAGTVISGNCIHDINRSHYGAQGFYFDQGSSDMLVCSNVVYRTQDATYNVGVPNRNIRGENNLLAFSSNYFLTAPAMKDRPKRSWSNLCERCVMLYDDKMVSRFPTDRGPMDLENAVFTNNVWIKSELRASGPDELMKAASTPEATAAGFRPFTLRIRQSEGLPAATDTFPPQELMAASAEPLTVAEERITCEGLYPYHLQGVTTDGTNIYWSFTTVLVKTDGRGRLLAKNEQDHSHMGDLCYKDGKVYVGMNFGPGGDAVWVYDAAMLKFEKKIPTPQTVFCNNGLEWYGDSFFIIGAAPQHSIYNIIYEYDANFKFRGCRFINSGWTLWGVQTLAVVGDKMVFGYYGANDPVMPHTAGTFVVKADDLPIRKQNAEFPTIIPSLGRVIEDTSEGVVVIGGRVWKAKSMKVMNEQDKSVKGLSGYITPTAKLTMKCVKGM